MHMVGVEHKLALPFSEETGSPSWPRLPSRRAAVTVGTLDFVASFLAHCGSPGSGQVVGAALVADVGNIMRCWQPRRKPEE